MRIAVIGGTGRTGALLVTELLRRGHDLAVLARTPGKLGATADSVRVVPGASTDAAAIAQLLDGADAVMSTLGPGARDDVVMSQTAQVLVPAMQGHGIRRYVGVGGAGMDLPGDRKGRKDRAISFMVQKVGGPMAADKRAEFALLDGSSLDYTFVRPPRLVDGAATGRIVHDAHTPGPSSSIRRADLASFLADVVEQGSYLRQAPFVSGAARSAGDLR